MSATERFVNDWDEIAYADPIMDTTTTTEGLSRVERRKLALRRDIIEAAFDCFAAEGYHATGIADIAAKLGIGHGTFYRYFENKRDIVEHVVADVVTKILAALLEENSPAAVTTLDDYRSQSARIAEALIDLLTQDPRLPRLLLLDAPGIDTAMAEQVLGFLEAATGITAGYLRHGVDNGYLRTDLDVEATAKAINGMIVGGVIIGIHDTDRVRLETYADAALRMMYDGISADGP